MQEYINNRITYKQRVNLAKKQARQTQRQKIYKEVREMIADVVLFIIAGTAISVVLGVAIIKINNI